MSSGPDLSDGRIVQLKPRAAPGYLRSIGVLGLLLAGAVVVLVLVEGPGMVTGGLTPLFFKLIWFRWVGARNGPAPRFVPGPASKLTMAWLGIWLVVGLSVLFLLRNTLPESNRICTGQEVLAFLGGLLIWFAGLVTGLAWVGGGARKSQKN
ncbi:MAG: hypothetical protein U0835_20240 [Isosphaeraceae bacterium]